MIAGRQINDSHTEKAKKLCVLHTKVLYVLARVLNPILHGGMALCHPLVFFL